ncbi:MAG: DUF4235 domain-containing protein [Gemmatimonadetes bacterium]|nr:DUF4235 domain-containing protein [Gemmatimonadota bacterium]
MNSSLMDRDDRFRVVLSGAAAAAAASLTRRTLARGWRARFGQDPPEDPSRADVSWRSALAWAFASAGAVAVSRVLAKRAAAAGCERAWGASQPG